MLAIIEELALVQDSLSACPPPWLENPYRLVGLDEIMEFDAGKFATVVLRSGAFRGVKLSPEAVFMRVWARF